MADRHTHSAVSGGGGSGGGVNNNRVSVEQQYHHHDHHDHHHRSSRTSRPSIRDDPQHGDHLHHHPLREPQRSSLDKTSRRTVDRYCSTHMDRTELPLSSRLLSPTIKSRYEDHDGDREINQRDEIPQHHLHEQEDDHRRHYHHLPPPYCRAMSQRHRPPLNRSSSNRFFIRRSPPRTSRLSDILPAAPTMSRRTVARPGFIFAPPSVILPPRPVNPKRPSHEVSQFARPPNILVPRHRLVPLAMRGGVSSKDTPEEGEIDLSITMCREGAAQELNERKRMSPLPPVHSYASPEKRQKTRSTVKSPSTDVPPQSSPTASSPGRHALVNRAWTIANVSLSSEGLERLEHGGLLDDSLIEFFFQFLHRYALAPAQSSRIFFFNSYFYSKLVEGGSTPQERHHAVRRWTNKVTTASGVNRGFIWDFDVVVVPLNHTGSHWTLALVTFPLNAVRRPDPESWPSRVLRSVRRERNKQVRVEDDNDDDIKTPGSFTAPGPSEVLTVSSGSDTDSSSPIEQRESINVVKEPCPSSSGPDIPLDCLDLQPGIFHLDSLEDSVGPPEQLKEILVAYFQEEFKARCPALFSRGHSIAAQEEWLYVPRVPVPTQQNGFDCGIFLIEYVRHLFLTHPTSIKFLLYEALTDTPPKSGPTPAMTAWLVENWFDQRVATHRRQCLKTMLQYMRQQPEWAEEWRGNDTGKHLKKLLELFNSLPVGRQRTPRVREKDVATPARASSRRQKTSPESPGSTPGGSASQPSAIKSPQTKNDVADQAQQPPPQDAGEATGEATGEAAAGYVKPSGSSWSRLSLDLHDFNNSSDDDTREMAIKVSWGRVQVNSTN